MSLHLACPALTCPVPLPLPLVRVRYPLVCPLYPTPIPSQSRRLPQIPCPKTPPIPQACLHQLPPSSTCPQPLALSVGCCSLPPLTPTPPTPLTPLTPRHDCISRCPPHHALSHWRCQWDAAHHRHPGGPGVFKGRLQREPHGHCTQVCGGRHGAVKHSR